MNGLKYLSRVRTACYLLAILGGVVIFFWNQLVLGGVLLAAVVVLELRFYRCPWCGHRLSMGLQLDQNTYCPRCGKVPAQGSFPSRKRP